MNHEPLSNHVCRDCGRPHLTNKQKEEDRVIAFHLGNCCVCGKATSVTHIRYYNYLKQKQSCKN